jgi:hypothetical protein
MDPKLDLPKVATCTSCTFKEDMSNYWTAVMYFRAQNGTYKRVPQIGNQYLEKSYGGMTIYYIPPYDGKTRVTAFQPVSQSFLEEFLVRFNSHSRVSECSLEIPICVRRLSFEKAVECVN